MVKVINIDDESKTKLILPLFLLNEASPKDLVSGFRY